MPPRRTSQAVKKDTEATEAKNEGGAPRRSGRAVSKPETSAREASRSRRSSTAAQTAASVADSKTPKGRGSVSSRRDSTSPSDLTASRAKTARRSTGRINYKESDGEEENAAPKVDDTFNSGDELDESESDENSKPKGKGKASRSPAKGRGAAKGKASTRSRRGRPSKKKRGGDEEDDEEEKETVEISDDSGEPEEVATKKTKAVKEKEPPKPSRSRRQRSKVTEIKIDDEKPKSSRRSSRGTSSKEESPKKRSVRNVQAKRYTEDDEVEEIDDAKDTEEVDKGTRKRKRGSSPEEASKRLKEDDESGDVKEVPAENKVMEEKEIKEKPVEAMEVDEPDLPEESCDTKADKSVDSEADKADAAPKKDVEDKEMLEESSSPQEEEMDEVSKEESVDSAEIIDKSKSCLIPGPEPKVKGSEPKVVAATKEEPKPVEVVEKSAEIPKESTSEKPEIPQLTEDKPVSENVTAPVLSDKPEVVNKVDSAPDPPTEQDDASKYDSPASDESKLTIDETQLSSSPTAATVPQPKETNQDAVLNGSEKTDVAPTIHAPSAHDIQIATSAKSEHTEKSTPTENGAHNDVQHTNSTPPADQYYSLPGRKYVSNSKLSDGVRQSVKDQTFGFVSYNLGGSDLYLQKEKLLNELNCLDARIICLQQVSKPFFNAVLEPSLDALGFKSIFSQPEDSLKGVATFYKTSLFKPTKNTEISLRKLVEKELESSSLSPEDRAAVKTHVKKCGNVLFMQFATVIGTRSFTVANVQIPPTDLSMHALQISCLAREVVKINGGTNVPLLLGGEFNLSENDASYQLLRDGYLSNDMIEELQRRKDIALPGKENESLVNLLWNLFQHPSSNLCSCYKSVLDHEFFIPETKNTSPDLLWFSSNSLHIVGVLDVVLDKPVDRNFSLKADVAFSV